MTTSVSVQPDFKENIVKDKPKLVLTTLAKMVPLVPITPTSWDEVLSAMSSILATAHQGSPE